MKGVEVSYSEDIYTENGVEDSLGCDGISAAEGGFMLGYLSA